MPDLWRSGISHKSLVRSLLQIRHLNLVQPGRVTAVAVVANPDAVVLAVDANGLGSLTLV